MILILGQEFFLSQFSVFYSAKYLIDVRVGELVGVIVCVNRSACVALNTMSVNRVHLNKISPSIQSSQNYTARLPSQEKPLEISLRFLSSSTLLNEKNSFDYNTEGSVYSLYIVVALNTNPGQSLLSWSRYKTLTC